MTTMEVMKEFFRRHSTSPCMWELHAVTLRYGMEVLFRQTFADAAVHLRHRKRRSLRPSLHGPGLMLAGMMLEAAAKAVLVARGTALTAKTFRNHDLLAIVSATGYLPTSDERHFLVRMSEFVRWAGRYPAPTKPERMGVKTPRGDLGMVGGSLLGADLRRARQIADRLEGLLPSTPMRRRMRLPSSSATADPWRTRRRK